MEETGNFLVLDQETTNLLLMLAKIHPYGSKAVLKVILKLYIKLAKNAKRKGLDAIDVLANIVERHITRDFEGFEVKKIKWISDLIERSEEPVIGAETDNIANDISELKTLVRRLQSSVDSAGPGRASELSSFQPQEAATLLKIDKGVAPKAKMDYRDIRRKKRPQKIEF